MHLGSITTRQLKNIIFNTIICQNRGAKKCHKYKTCNKNERCCHHDQANEMDRSHDEGKQ